MPSRTLILVVGPALLLAGVVLMSMPDVWTVSHLVFLAGTLAMLPAGALLYDLQRVDGPAWVRWSGRGLVFAGALALAGQFLIDFVVMRLARGDSETAGTMFDLVQDSSPFALTFYQMGPALLFTGLAVFGIGFVRRSGPWRSSGWLLVAGAVVMGAARLTELRLAEVVGLGLILAALVLTARPETDRSSLVPLSREMSGR